MKGDNNEYFLKNFFWPLNWVNPLYTIFLEFTQRFFFKVLYNDRIPYGIKVDISE